jgi:hypothetical protein
MLNIPGLEEQQQTGLVKKLMAEADQDAKPWVHYPGVFSKDEADKLFAYFLKQPWVASSDAVCPNRGGYYLKYGIPYSGSRNFLKEKQDVAGPIPTTPGWNNLLKKVQDKFRAPVNYVQCHLFAPGHAVHPHFDPGGMIVPMLTLGQERTFRVGGECNQCYPGHPDYVLEQTCRDIFAHKPDSEYLMRHGDLLVFVGGNTIHSMYPASKDTRFNPNGYDWRISILFRWTSPAMAQYGAGNAAHKKEMKQQYAEALARWRKENPGDEAL